MKRLIVAGLLVATSAFGRDALGVHEGWGAFRDANPLHCYAIAEPVETSGGRWRPFASVSHWPQDKVKGQLHLRLSHERRADADVMLVIGNKKWRLVAGKTDAWGPSSKHDEFIIAKMRAATSMSVSSISATGGGFADTYALKGAATAIDTAALGCAAKN